LPFTRCTTSPFSRPRRWKRLSSFSWKRRNPAGRPSSTSATAGFRLFQLKDESLFHRLGLENGDVVQRVNGNAVGDPTALLGFLSRLRTEPRVAIDVVRGGTPRTLVYELR